MSNIFVVPTNHAVWDAVDGALSYDVRIGEISNPWDPNTNGFDKEVNVASNSVSMADLMPMVECAWGMVPLYRASYGSPAPAKFWVRAVGEWGPGPWSDPFPPEDYVSVALLRVTSLNFSDTPSNLNPESTLDWGCSDTADSYRLEVHRLDSSNQRVETVKTIESYSSGSISIGDLLSGISGVSYDYRFDVDVQARDAWGLSMIESSPFAKTEQAPVVTGGHIE